MNDSFGTDGTKILERLNQTLDLILSGMHTGQEGLIQVSGLLFSKPTHECPVIYLWNEGKFDPITVEEAAAQEYVWIKTVDLTQLKKHLEKIILQADRLIDPAISQQTRMELLRKSAMSCVEDLFETPSEQNIQRSSRVVSSFVYVLMKDPKSYLLLTRLSSHDPYTLQHSVGTAVNSIILARKLGITEQADLEEVGLAGLLHDIGKTRVRKEIINKPGALSDEEWTEMRRHAEEGYQIVRDIPFISERTKRAILEHHEDRNGTGYPQGLNEEEVDQFSRIVCISDVFNALTTTRSYSSARTPFDALSFMREKMAHKFDEESFKALVLIYGGQAPEPLPAVLPKN